MATPVPKRKPGHYIMVVKPAEYNNEVVLFPRKSVFAGLEEDALATAAIPQPVAVGLCRALNLFDLLEHVN